MIGNDEAIKAYARWTASSFAQFQMRLACSNTFDEAAEPDMPLPDFCTNNDTITHETFMRMARCIFRAGAGEQDVMALLKRAHVILFGDKRVHLREACATPMAVKCINYPASGKDLLSPDCKTKFGQCKEGAHITPIVAELDWSAVFIRKCLRSETITGFTTTAAHISTFTGMAVPEQDRKPRYDWADSSSSTTPSDVVIKREPGVWKRSFSKTNVVIDISSPPTKKRVSTEVDNVQDNVQVGGSSSSAAVGAPVPTENAPADPAPGDLAPHTSALEAELEYMLNNIEDEVGNEHESVQSIDLD